MPKRKSAKLKKEWSRNDKLGLVGIILAAISAIAALVVIPEIRSALESPQKEGLEIVDVSLNDVIDVMSLSSKANLNSSLDIKVRNVGDEVVFINRVDLDIEGSYLLDLYAACQAGGVPISVSYDIRLPKDGTRTVSKEISQSINVNDVDRFVLYLEKPYEKVDRLGTIFDNKFRIYKLKLTLIYNKENSVTSESLYIFTPAFHPFCTFFSDEIINSENRIVMSDNDKQIFLDIDDGIGKTSSVTQKLIQVAKGECVLLTQNIEFGAIECSGEHIKFAE